MPVETDIITRLWVLLEANAQFTALVKPGNRIKYDRAWAADPYKQQVAPADFPEVEVDYRADEWSGYIDDEHYGYGADTVPANEAFLETDTHTLTITVSGKDTQLAPNNQLVFICRKILRDAGPTLGTSYIQRWGKLRRADQVTNIGKYGRGAWRRVSTLTIPVVTQAQGNTQL